MFGDWIWHFSLLLGLKYFHLPSTRLQQWACTCGLCTLSTQLSVLSKPGYAVTALGFRTKNTLASIQNFLYFQTSRPQTLWMEGPLHENKLIAEGLINKSKKTFFQLMSSLQIHILLSISFLPFKVFPWQRFLPLFNGIDPRYGYSWGTDRGWIVNNSGNEEIFFNSCWETQLYITQHQTSKEKRIYKSKGPCCGGGLVRVPR